MSAHGAPLSAQLPPSPLLPLHSHSHTLSLVLCLVCVVLCLVCVLQPELAESVLVGIEHLLHVEAARVALVPLLQLLVVGVVVQRHGGGDDGGDGAELDLVPDGSSVGSKLVPAGSSDG